MVRGYYTAVSGMQAQQRSMEAIANNLANANTTGYKNDVAIFKAFPEMLMSSTNEIVAKLPPSTYKGEAILFGSSDITRTIGKLGTGVEVNEVYTSFDQGSLRQTENEFDIALEGEGFFSIETPQGERYTRDGSFILGQEGLLMTKEGYPVLGEKGHIYVKANNFNVDKIGIITINAKYGTDKDVLVPAQGNDWNETEELDKLKLVQVKRPRYLVKEGHSLYKSTDDSGIAEIINSNKRPVTIQGFLELSNINPVKEMTRMISVNRAYEANSKTLKTQDEALSKLVNDYMSLK